MRLNNFLFSKKNLFDAVYTTYFSTCSTKKAIDALLDHVLAVWSDEAAKQELKDNNRFPFEGIQKHFKIEAPYNQLCRIIRQMIWENSVCTAIMFDVYH